MFAAGFHIVVAWSNPRSLVNVLELMCFPLPQCGEPESHLFDGVFGPDISALRRYQNASDKKEHEERPTTLADELDRTAQPLSILFRLPVFATGLFIRLSREDGASFIFARPMR